jgi:hypothetical protein
MANFTKRLFDSLPIGLLRFALNLWPPFWGAGIHVKKISPDFRHIEVVMKLHWYNQNYKGVHYGGSLYSMTDSFPMLMVSKNLGDDYIVWDKAARINYQKPGRGTVFASFDFSEEEIAAIRKEADNNEKYLFDREIHVVDTAGEIITTVIKTIYVRKKRPDPS